MRRINSYCNTNGNYSKTNSKRCEICSYRDDLNYDYTVEKVMNLIKSKRMLIDNRNHGSFNSAELLIDEEMYEEKYLSAEQREFIYLHYELKYNVTEIMKLKKMTFKKLNELRNSIEQTLKENLEVR